ncbi:MAG: nicotinate-nucleotide adenylyltransferase [Acidobacteriaceae bacterium]
MFSMRLALFGGTFDPIHRGHLAIASAAADAFALDRVIVAPTGRQPLKSEPPVASFADRLAMATLACIPAPADPGDSRFVVSSLDEPKADGSPNYTVDLLKRVAESNPGVEVSVLTGADSFLTIRRWREPEKLLRVYQWLVVSRPGSPLTEEQLASLSLTASERQRVHMLTSVHEDISATVLRRRLAGGDACADLIPAPVAAYIRKKDLYRTTGSPEI